MSARTMIVSTEAEAVRSVQVPGCSSRENPAEAAAQMRAWVRAKNLRDLAGPHASLQYRIAMATTRANGLVDPAKSEAATAIAQIAPLPRHNKAA